MGKIEAETCSVCKENPSKYRCPACAAPYCSLACNKAHKAGSGVEGEENYAPPCTGKRSRGPPAQNGSSSSQQATTKRPRGGDGVENSGMEGEALEEDGMTTTACVRKGRDQWRGGREDLEDEEWQMSADQMKRISGCAWLQAALRDPKLQGLLVSDTRYQARIFFYQGYYFGRCLLSQHLCTPVIGMLGTTTAALTFRVDDPRAVVLLSLAIYSLLRDALTLQLVPSPRLVSRIPRAIHRANMGPYRRMNCILKGASAFFHSGPQAASPSLLTIIPPSVP